MSDDSIAGSISISFAIMSQTYPNRVKQEVMRMYLLILGVKLYKSCQPDIASGTTLQKR